MVGIAVFLLFFSILKLNSNNPLFRESDFIQIQTIRLQLPLHSSLNFIINIKHNGKKILCHSSTNQEAL